MAAAGAAYSVPKGVNLFLLGLLGALVRFQPSERPPASAGPLFRPSFHARSRAARKQAPSRAARLAAGGPPLAAEQPRCALTRTVTRPKNIFRRASARGSTPQGPTATLVRAQAACTLRRQSDRLPRRRSAPVPLGGCQALPSSIRPTSWVYSGVTRSSTTGHRRQRGRIPRPEYPTCTLWRPVLVEQAERWRAGLQR